LDAGNILCYDTARFFIIRQIKTPEMSYSGNPALSSDVKQRILSTFDQTLELAREGNRQEALLGCDFVLRMDPQYQPAHLLQERLRATTGPVRVDDLHGSPAMPALDDPFADLAGLSLELPDALPDHGGGALRPELQSLLDQRRFPELMAAAQREHAAVMADPELQRLVGTAQERMEAEPYVLKFLASARQALQTGDGAETARLLDKARSLDAAHPGIVELDRLRAAGPAAAPPLKIPSPIKTGAMPVSLAFGGGDSESDRRIRELLDEGQAAFDGGDPQGAIDSWSRIFLIDIDHQEASRRIEAARKLKAESERQAEEVFHDGLAQLDAGDAAGARRAFQRVLEIQPGYFAAREYLQQLDAGTALPARGAAPREALIAEPVIPLPSSREVAGHDLKEEILVPPEPSGEPTAPERKTVRNPAAARARDGGRARRLFLLVGGAVLLLALAGAWFFLQHREQLFPNSREEAAPPAAAAKPSTDPITRAERLNKAGRTTTAVSQLRRIPQNDPHYAQAQKLIAQWTGAPGGAAPGTAAGAGAANPAAPGAPGAPAAPLNAETTARRASLLAAAHQSLAEHGYVRALGRLEQADTLARLDGDDAQLLADTRKRLEPLASQIDLFRQHEWEHVLPDLWRMHDADPGNRDVTQLIVDSYYDLAVRDLQRADAKKAGDNFKEALNLQQDDEALKRHYLFAQTYQERPKDLLYRIYVKYLPYR
jgi:tetratricopeptide (TPR) repeat protein